MPISAVLYTHLSNKQNMEINIFDYGMNGEGVGKLDGKIVLVPNSIPGETVDIDICSDHKNYAQAKLNKIILKSPNRTNPICPYFFDCGGCDLQHMSYSEQLKFKQQLVKKTLKKVAGIEFDVQPCIESKNQLYYRNKVSFDISNKKYGFFKKSSNQTVDINDCFICDKDFVKILKEFKNFVNSGKILEKNPKFDENCLKNLVIRKISEQILVAVVSKSFVDLSDFLSILKQLYSQIGLYLVLNNRNDSVVLSGKAIHVGGIEKINIFDFGVSYSVDLFGFHQTNQDIQNKIYKTVLDCINTDSTVVNGFSGQGLLSVIVASKAKYVYGIEINKNSHQSSQNLLKVNKITNQKNILGDFNKEIKKIKNFDTLIIDPAKRGCGEEVMNNIKGVENIIYISCNPIAMSKDIRVLKQDYDIEKIIPFDMFPQTKNVETLIKLKLKNK